MKTCRLEKGRISSGVLNAIIIVSKYYLHWPKTNKTWRGNKKNIVLQIINMIKKPLAELVHQHKGKQLGRRGSKKTGPREKEGSDTLSKGNTGTFSLFF